MNTGCYLKVVTGFVMVFTNTDPRGNYYLSTRTKFGFYENLYIRISSIEFVLFGESITYFLSNDFTCFIL